MHPTIPLYTADRELTDWISKQQAIRLERLALVQAVRHRKGRVARCILRRRPGDPRPVRLSDYLGTRYSFLQRPYNGGQCWRLRRLGCGDELWSPPCRMSVPNCDVRAEGRRPVQLSTDSCWGPRVSEDFRTRRYDPHPCMAVDSVSSARQSAADLRSGDEVGTPFGGRRSGGDRSQGRPSQF